MCKKNLDQLELQTANRIISELVTFEIIYYL